ncbi:DUF4407 domain-containing protein [Nocardia farcinica]|uniref:DUF4407 domain-containing protein n=1 Tax=Nocardia farcinica TaxID=37329 RepID=UPI001894BE2C|nr:DUF4407 domain-containing protein [Nocardia farcinica]MBF6263927.1 DUF4407 domain-containing protein [Nocardia farcinica]MBF6283203.1 DUF4407 domain-containing protein [Nocardia farcinica]MBF6306793.1 DUF4407 domain-containing protein [Nocardia farcinica]MBF6391218.1 DUF4407 domain-containing protein [Nocardia farcinica]MBF6493241.1 DUF4407 domain-containing protein [Nocardia farcinica]
MSVTGAFTWLGGARPGAVDEPHERASYLLTGAAVALFALVTGGIVTAAAARAWPLAAAIAVGAVLAAAALLVGRALATPRVGPAPDRFGVAGRATAAVLIGVLVAEAATTLLFTAGVDRVLDEKAHAAAESAPAVRAARAGYERAVADRAGLDRTIAEAKAETDRALVTARCEYNPAPQCPPTRITGVPGDGPEHRTAQEMLAEARARLAAAEARVPGLDARVAEAEKSTAAALSDAHTAGDRGVGARWAAMHDHTTDSMGALLPRLATLLACLLLALLPLLLRWWRGVTSVDRHAAARAVIDEADRDAEAAIAVTRANLRAATAELRAEQELTAARLAAEADTAIDRERQRTRIIAAIGGLEIGITEPPRTPIRPAAGQPELPAAPVPREDTAVPETPNLPARAADERPGGGLELPIIGTVPFTDTAARWIRPLVPGFVADAIDTATHPLRTARQAFEEVEEITLTFRRTRKVTVDDSASSRSYPAADPWYAQRVAAAVVDVPVREAAAAQPNPGRAALTTAEPTPALLDRDQPAVSQRQGPPALPPAH